MSSSGLFYDTLTPTEKRRMDAVVDYKKACASETMGFGCPAGFELLSQRQLSTHCGRSKHS
jgi:hypothetical protein